MISNITPLLSASFADKPHIFDKCVLAQVDIPLLQQYIDEKDDRIDTYLVEEEKIQFSRFKLPKRRYEWLSGRIAAKFAAIQQFSSNTMPAKNQWHSLKVFQDDNGKPSLLSLKNFPLPHISISHSQGVAVALASQYPCGVDIQAITATLEKVEERFVTPEEQKLLAGSIQAREKKYVLGAIWSAKEAIKKASRLRPLPGFLEISLRGFRKENGYQFEMVFERDKSKIKLHYRVFAVLYDSYSLALTFNEDDPC